MLIYKKEKKKVEAIRNISLFLFVLSSKHVIIKNADNFVPNAMV